MPSTTLLSVALGVPGSTVVMVGCSLSMMPPVAVTPPMVSSTVSGEAESMTVSSLVV